MKPLRSLMIGDCDHYVSPYMRGVAQAMEILGHHHAQVSIRLSAKTIDQRVRMWRPDIIWTQMLLWAPRGAPKTPDLIAIVSAAARRGARVLIHDGDARVATRYPHDISEWCSLALLNHGNARTAWRVPTMRWPYFAPAQKEIAKATGPKCELFFAGRLGGDLYGPRTALIEAIRARGVKLFIPEGKNNTLDLTPAIAASVDAVLGFGRPDIPGWCDTRVFQYPGAGGVLVHDDVQGYLEPWTHYVPYQSGSAESVVEALGRLKAMPEDERLALRRRAFAHVQQHHSSVARVSQVLHFLEMA